MYMYIYIYVCVCVQYINPVYPPPKQRVLVQGTGGCWTWASSISDRSSSAATLSLCKWDAPFGTKKQRKGSKTKAQNDPKGSEMDMKNENHEGPLKASSHNNQGKICKMQISSSLSTVDHTFSSQALQYALR